MDLDPEQLVFIDETWTATNMTRSHGRCRRGERLRMGYPHGHRKTTTLVAGLRMTGMVAPTVLDGPINGDWFEAYVGRVLVPELKPGDVVIMDTHRGQHCTDHRGRADDIDLEQRADLIEPGLLDRADQAVARIVHEHFDCAHRRLGRLDCRADRRAVGHVEHDRDRAVRCLTASAFLEALIAAVPYKIHTVLTDNGIQFTLAPRYADGPTARYITHMFDMRCEENGIEHRLTKVKHPWTNGQVERMNRTIKEATVKRYHYDDHRQLETHLADFIAAYNYARRLKTLRGLTPHEFICKAWAEQPKRFTPNPHHHAAGPNN